MGEAFKPETNLVTGSPSKLLASVLRERNVNCWMYDPIVHPRSSAVVLDGSAVFFIGCRHECFATVKYPRGSVVIDPHRYVPDQDGVKVIRLGEGEK
jgi:UDPglucose 6-dehydrogenase